MDKNHHQPKNNILLLYTGGTIGSFIDHKTESLKPVDFTRLLDFLPELTRVNANIEVKTLGVPKDSSDMQPGNWVEIVKAIEENYEKYDGFVVLHGTDTMAYTASAVSFLIENLKKPVIFTGSQIPIGVIRTDGKENLITAIEIAAAQKNGKPLVPEVCIYFEFKLYRANRTFKYSANHFNAYESPNYPLLAEAGVNIEYFEHAVLPVHHLPVKFYTTLDTNVAVLKIFPGMSLQVLEGISNASGIRAIIIETFGSGNGPLQPWFFEWMHACIRKGIILVNITQCCQGKVEQGRYETSMPFKNAGVISGYDMTVEAALTKMMYVLGEEKEPEKIRQRFGTVLRGEMTV